jgi:hypothetical protein
MARIIVQKPSGDSDLASGFVDALNMLKESGFKPLPGTKLVSRYAVIVVDDPSSTPAVERLRASNVAAFVEPSRPPIPTATVLR